MPAASSTPDDLYSTVRRSNRESAVSPAEPSPSAPSQPTQPSGSLLGDLPSLQPRRLAPLGGATDLPPLRGVPLAPLGGAGTGGLEKSASKPSGLVRGAAATALCVCVAYPGVQGNSSLGGKRACDRRAYRAHRAPPRVLPLSLLLLQVSPREPTDDPLELEEIESEYSMEQVRGRLP